MDNVAVYRDQYGNIGTRPARPVRELRGSDLLDLHIGQLQKEIGDFGAFGDEFGGAFAGFGDDFAGFGGPAGAPAGYSAPAMPAGPRIVPVQQVSAIMQPEVAARAMTCAQLLVQAGWRKGFISGDTAVTAALNFSVSQAFTNQFSIFKVNRLTAQAVQTAVTAAGTTGLLVDLSLFFRVTTFTLGPANLVQSNVPYITFAAAATLNMGGDEFGGPVVVGTQPITITSAVQSGVTPAAGILNTTLHGAAWYGC